MIGKLIGNPYMLVGVAVACFIAGATVNGWRLNSAHKNTLAAAIEAQSQAYKDRDAFHAERQAADNAAGVTAAELRAELEDTRNTITAAIAGQRFTHREAPTHETPCPDTRRSAAYRLCVNAALTGDAAAIAACEAGRGDGALQSEPVPTSSLVRSRQPRRSSGARIELHDSQRACRSSVRGESQEACGVDLRGAVTNTTLGKGGEGWRLEGMSAVQRR